MASQFVVSVWLCDRAYGGPEEGGWYYDVGEEDTSFSAEKRFFDSEDDAYAYREELEALCAEHNDGRYPISSVLSSGEYVARVTMSDEPRYYPSVRPHYE